MTSIKKKEKVTDQVFAQIVDAIKRGEIKPGDRLPGARELADKMKVGISTVREALKMLESLGAVESRQGEGTFICNTLREGAANAFEIQLALLPLTAEYLVEFRVIYETAYMRLAMEHATDEDLKKVEAAVIALEDKVKKSSDAFTEAEDELFFHNEVLYCTHNPYIIKTGEVALALFFDVMHNRLEPLVVTEAAKDHRNIYEAICAKDNDRMDKVLNKCFSWWGSRFKENQEPVMRNE